MNSPLLSVCLITYQHASFIRQAIESVLMQKVNFHWELIIADDFSTDGTREILLGYKKKYSEFIRLILQEENVGATKNWMDLIKTPQSKYITCFEGDDYWIDPHKLQNQVDFLEANPEYGVVCTDYHIMNEKGEITKYNYLKKLKKEKLNRDISFEDIIVSTHPIRTATACFRREHIDSFINVYLNNIRGQFKIGDIPLWLHISLRSKLKYLTITTAVYRITPGTASRLIDPKDQFEFGIGVCNMLSYFVEKHNNTQKLRRVILKKRLYIELRFAYKAGNLPAFLRTFWIVSRERLIRPRALVYGIGCARRFFLNSVIRIVNGR